MAYCCVCGKIVEEDHGMLLVRGRPVPICMTCGNILDDVEPLQQNDPKRKELYRKIQERMKNGAGPAVIETIGAIFGTTENVKSQKYVEQDEMETGRETEHNIESPKATTSEATISSLSNFLSGFAVVFLILAIILCFVIGIPLTRYKPTTGWTVIIGGVLGSILTFSVIMLMLSIATTIGNISNKLSESNKHMAENNKQLNRIVNMITAEVKKQKK